MEAQYPIWHPFTQMKTAAPPLQVASGKDEFLYLADGRKIIDCISSWWVTLHGHANEQIAAAISEQAKTLEQVIFAGFTHEPAIQLANSLLQKLPQGLGRVFFSDNGSTSVEVALKMAYQYWQNVGMPQRSRFIGFQGGYHGDTLGAMSAGGSSTFWNNFKRLMFDIDVVSYPQTWEGDESIDEKEQQCFRELCLLLENNPQSYAGIIIEPLVQGAAGMRVCRASFIQRLRMLANQFAVLLIFDEVMTGFGRTGDWFASKRADCTPDIICLSKGITGGFLPLSVTVCTEGIYGAFLADELDKALFHSHSYTANPIACAAANASMKLLEQSEPIFRGFETRHQAMVDKHLRDSGLFEHFRCRGTIAAFDVVDGNSDYYSALPAQLRAEFINRGLLLRPLGNTIYLMPPLCTTDESLETAYQTIRDVVGQAMTTPSATIPTTTAWS